MPRSAIFMMKRRTVLNNVKKAFTHAMQTAMVLYVLFMLFQLFLRRMGADLIPAYFRDVQDYGYWQIVWCNTNLIPFHTVREFAAQARQDGIFSWAFINLAGNVLLFMPAGIFLPYFREKQKKFSCFFLTIVLMIVCVELVQVLALIGSCDIDDLILNVLGAMIGFGCYKMTERMLRHGKRKSEN